MSEHFKCPALRASISIDQCSTNQARAGRGSPCQDCELGRRHRMEVGLDHLRCEGSPLGLWAPGECLMCSEVAHGLGLCESHYAAWQRHRILTLPGTTCWICRQRPASGSGICRPCGLAHPQAIHLGRSVQVDGTDLVLDGARYFISEVRMSTAGRLRAQWRGGLIVEAHGGLLVGEERS